MVELTYIYSFQRFTFFVVGFHLAIVGIIFLILEQELKFASFSFRFLIDILRLLQVHIFAHTLAGANYGFSW